MFDHDYKLAALHKTCDAEDIREIKIRRKSLFFKKWSGIFKKKWSLQLASLPEKDGEWSGSERYCPSPGKKGRWQIMIQFVMRTFLGRFLQRGLGDAESSCGHLSRNPRKECSWKKGYVLTDKQRTWMNRCVALHRYAASGLTVLTPWRLLHLTCMVKLLSPAHL